VINHTHRRRVKIAVILGLTVWLVLLARLIEIQILDRPALADAARQKMDCRQRIPARRGDVLDRDRQPLARTVSGYAVKFVPSEAAHREESIAMLARLLDEAPDRLRRKACRNRPFLAKRGLLLDHDRVRALCALEAVYLEREQARVYPHGQNGAHMIGFASVDNAGLEGVELQFDAELSGLPGWAVMALDGKGRNHSLPGEFFRAPKDGDQVVLALDRDCQAIVEQELRRGVEESGAASGTVIVMDPRNGDVVALANHPGFDPNDPGEYPNSNRRNRAVTDIFEPGSTFKIVTLAASVRHEVVGPDTLLNAENGCAQFDGYTIRDHHPYGEITFREAVEHSSNICFAKVAQRIGKENLYQLARDFGIGCPTGVQLPGETGGLLRPPREWSRRSLSTISIGQEVAVSALQLVNVAAAVANGGALMVPRISLGLMNGEGKWLARHEPRRLRTVLTKEESRRVTDYLVGVVERGTGHLARVPGIPVAGKTGTAQKAEGGGYVPGKYVASFVGYLPADDPMAVILVVLDEPQEKYYGGEVAAPLFRSIVERIMTTQGVQMGEELVRWRLAQGRNEQFASLTTRPSSDVDREGVGR
jgi:cell division protein FtsI (penicillin-binding protein 3)